MRIGAPYSRPERILLPKTYSRTHPASRTYALTLLMMQDARHRRCASGTSKRNRVLFIAVPWRSCTPNTQGNDVAGRSGCVVYGVIQNHDSQTCTAMSVDVEVASEQTFVQTLSINDVTWSDDMDFGIRREVLTQDVDPGCIPSLPHVVQDVGHNSE